MSNKQPLISFSFDDFPRSAYQVGGRILEDAGLRGTYYTSFGLMGQETATGSICHPEEVLELVSKGHEVGCHTYFHSHSWTTPSSAFSDSMRHNAEALKKLLPHKTFRTFSYPLCVPSPFNKRNAGAAFRCCRAGGQKSNIGVVDLNLLNAFFLEKAKGDLAQVERLIETNRQSCGWLIFATHDISENPTEYGCTPEFFEQAVRASVKSGARILTVSEGSEEIM